METIIKSFPRTNFTIIPNSLLRNEDLSLRSKGLLCMILSHDSSWNVTKEWVYQHVKEGRDAIDAMFTELKKAGYLEVHMETDPETKRFSRCFWIFHDEPKQDRSDGTLDGGLRGGENPGSGNRGTSEYYIEKKIGEGTEEKKEAQAPPAQPLESNLAQHVEAPTPEGGLHQAEPPKNSAAPPLPPPQARKPRAKAPQDSRHSQLVEAFCGAYQARFGSKYLFQGGKDATAVVAILRAAQDMSVPDIMAIITRAWDDKSQFIRSAGVSLSRIPSIWSQLIASRSQAKPAIASHIKMRGDAW